MRRKLNISSRRQVLLTMMIFVIPLLFLIGTFNFYIVKAMNAKIESSNRNTLSVYQHTFEQNLNNAQEFMSNLVSNDYNFLSIMARQDPLNRQILAQNVMKTYQGYFNTNEIMGGLFVYSGANELFYRTYSQNYPHEVREGVETYLKGVLQSKDNFRAWKWFAEKIDGTYYLFRIVGNQDTYSIGMIDLSRAVDPRRFADNRGDDFFVIADEEGNPLTYADELSRKGIALVPHNDSHYLAGQSDHFFIVQNESPQSRLTYIYIMPYLGLTYYLDKVQIAFFAGSALLLLLMVVSFLLLERSYFLPLKRMIATMNRIKSGFIHATMSTDYRVREFRDVSHTFNGMMAEIKNLKIESYEKEMQRQAAELQFLQIQIRPHFYLNVLKNLFGIAEQKKYDQIQEMILLLSRHLRYMFQENSSLIPLSAELDNVGNYIELQRMSSSRPIQLKVQVDERLSDLAIPPISVLTFVENSLKHALDVHKPLAIAVKAQLIKDGETSYVNLRITDNGPGFSEQMLARLNGGDPSGPSPSGRQVGIANVIRRYNFVYHNQCSFLFGNSNGACIDIFIPFEG